MYTFIWHDVLVKAGIELKYCTLLSNIFYVYSLNQMNKTLKLSW